METVNGKSTGLAQINVAENGDNQIVIIPGANDILSAADVEKAQDVLDASKVYFLIWLFDYIYILTFLFNNVCCEGFSLSIGDTITSNISGSTKI